MNTTIINKPQIQLSDGEYIAIKRVNIGVQFKQSGATFQCRDDNYNDDGDYNRYNSIEDALELTYDAFDVDGRYWRYSDGAFITDWLDGRDRYFAIVQLVKRTADKII